MFFSIKMYTLWNEQIASSLWQIDLDNLKVLVNGLIEINVFSFEKNNKPSLSILY